SLSLVRDDLVDVSDNDTKNIIYLISDGIETCDGDPVETVEEIKDDVDNVTINIIGFDVDDAANQLLKDIADAGDGKYNTAQNEAQLGEAIEDQWHQKIDDNELVMWSAHQLIDIQSRGNKLYSEFDEKYKYPLGQVYSREEKRFRRAVTRLQQEELIDATQYSEINDLVMDRHTSIKDHAKTISDDKRNKRSCRKDRKRIYRIKQSMWKKIDLSQAHKNDYIFLVCFSCFLLFTYRFHLRLSKRSVRFIIG